MSKSDAPPPKKPPLVRKETMEVQMHWLDDAKEPPPASDGPPSSKRGPPRLPGAPEMPPMPVTSADVPSTTNKTIEVEPQWLELVEERRAKKAQEAAKSAANAEPPAPAKNAPAPSAAPISPADASHPRPRLRPIIPRGDD